MSSRPLLWPRLFELEVAAPLRGGFLDAKRSDRLSDLLAGRPCIDFQDDPLGPGPNPLVEQGVSFEVQATVSGDPGGGQTRIEQPAGGPRGLLCGSLLEIALPQPVAQVELLLTNLGELTIEAQRADGVERRVVKAGELHGSPIAFTTDGILALRLRGPVDGTWLHRICFGAHSPLPDRVLPVALRWRLSPSIGIPREPFQVWRRPRADADAAAQDLKLGEVSVAAERVVEWGRKPLFELRFLAQPDSGQVLTAEALDDQGASIPGERLTLTATAPVRLRAPDLCALRVAGNGKLSALSGVPMADYAALPGWELTETVGLPFAKDETPPAVYDSASPQGRPAHLQPGLDAARERLAVGGILFEPPPAVAPATPVWPVPSPDQVLTEVRGGSPNPLDLVREMLAAVDPALLSPRQELYVKPVEVDGFRQPPNAAAQQKATLDLPVAGIVLMSAATDGWSALALGFGTTDLPPYLPPPGQHAEPPRPALPGYDYRVTVGVRLPFGLQVEIAALAAERFPPPVPAELRVRTALRNRPAVRDGPASEDVEMLWRRPDGAVSPHGGVLAVGNGGAPGVLNEPRSTVGFIPYVAASRPDGDLENEAFASFVDTVRPAPLLGARTDTYLAALLDVFFRWSGWSTTPHAIAAGGPGQPQILDVRFSLDPDAAVGDEVSAALEVDVAWDWEDRSPQEIRLVGAFHPPATAPPPTPPAGLQLRPGGLPGVPVVLAFSATADLDQTPTLTAGSGTVARLDIQSQDGDSRRYRVTLSGLTAVFQGATRLAYAVYAQAREQVAPALPGPFTPPRSAQVRDPRPAPVPALPPGLRWTALPDATGTARIRLAFPAVQGAAGYVVYEATEAALREAGGLGTAAGDLFVRAGEIDALADLPALQDVLARAAADPLPVPETDLGLPGATDGLYAFAFASLTAEQVESARSRPVLVAVPRLVTPGAPWLHARAEAGGVAVTVGRGAGAPPAAAELYRTQAPLLKANVDDMGEPVAAQDDPRWTASDLDGDGIPDEIRLLDAPPPSWLPYLYRAVAFGENNPAAGRLPGRSRSSPGAEVLLTPGGPPDLQPIRLALVAGGTLYRVQVRSSAEIRLSPVGVHHMEVSTVSRVSVRPEETLHASADLPAIAPEDPAAAPAAGAITRDVLGGRDASDRWLYESFVPKKDAEVAVRLTDPLGRVSEQRAPLGDPPDLAVVDARWVGTDLRVIFRSAAPIAPPPLGEYVVEVLDATAQQLVLLGTASLHSIGPATRPFFRNPTPLAGGPFAYRFLHTAPPGSVQQVLVRLRDPFGLTTVIGRTVA